MDIYKSHIHTHTSIRTNIYGLKFWNQENLYTEQLQDIFQRGPMLFQHKGRNRKDTTRTERIEAHDHRFLIDGTIIFEQFWEKSGHILAKKYLKVHLGCNREEEYQTINHPWRFTRSPQWWMEKNLKCSRTPQSHGLTYYTEIRFINMIINKNRYL